MKTVTDFKRLMVPGSKWQTTHEFLGARSTPPKDLGIRECGKVQSNAFALIMPDDSTKAEQAGRLSWCDWPKAKECTFTPDSVTITKPDFCRLTYKLTSARMAG